MADQAGNVLLECLPDLPMASALGAKLARLPAFDERELRLAAVARLQAVCRLSIYFQPLFRHFSVIDKIFLAVVEGYLWRNPCDKDFIKRKNAAYLASLEGDFQPIELPVPSTAPSWVLLGISGVGKTTTVEVALSFLPQVVHHPQINVTQLVWAKIEFPFDGRIKQCCLRILTEFDLRLGTGYVTQIGGEKATLDAVLRKIAHASSEHYVGLFVFDEFQNILLAPREDQDAIRNFCVSIANELRIPSLFVGTPKGKKLLEKGVFAQLRRLESYGGDEWGPLVKGPELETFLASLQRFQWITKPVDLVQHQDLIEELTGGVTALIVRLFQLVQQSAILNATVPSKEVITAGTLKRIFNANFAKLKPMIAALRKGDFNALEGELFVKALLDLAEAVNKKPSEQAAGAQRKVKEAVPMNNEAFAISSLVSLNIQAAEAQRMVKEWFATNPDSDAQTCVITLLKQMPLAGAADNSRVIGNILAANNGASSPTEALRNAGVINAEGIR
jgi:hypothetical protein